MVPNSCDFKGMALASHLVPTGSQSQQSSYWYRNCFNASRSHSGPLQNDVSLVIETEQLSCEDEGTFS